MRIWAKLSKVGWLAALMLSLGLLAAPNANATVAYEVVVQPGVPNAANVFTGSLGMDFNVLEGKTISVDSLGVFDDGGNGIIGTTLHAAIFSRTSLLKVTGILDFSTSDPGTLVGGSRFKDLPSAVTLGAGAYTIVAWGYNSTERDGNQGFPPIIPSTMNDGGGLIEFVGVGRYNTTPGAYPSTLAAGPENRYLAGTFSFVPLPASVLLLGSGLLGLGLLRFRKRA